jgi:anti-sigma factor ChrR (cupin superfamily)
MMPEAGIMPMRYRADLLMPIARAVASHIAMAPAADDDIADFLAGIRTVLRDPVPSGHVSAAPGPLDAVLADALHANTKVAAIADALAAFDRPLPWRYHYPRRADAPDLAERIGFAELVGPSAPVPCATCRVGFTLMARDTFYPTHTHPAVELYLVVSGTARWRTPVSDRDRPPGAFVLHRSNEPHAMRTAGKPLLALYAWRGQIDAPAVYSGC